ncbi:MAG TPA: SpoIIE family protein phosphatase [Actinospica sp.]|nr:SpoIIE family protein phosphatase [Actinospica sp.]
MQPAYGGLGTMEPDERRFRHGAPVEGAAPEGARLDLFALDDTVGPDLARVDWPSTAIGPPEGWPASLRTALGILLTSRFPMWMAWGAELTFFCNAAYRRDTLGRKYPWALGRPASEVWAEIWPEIGPRIRSVLETGEATWDEALLLFLERSGYREETYHTFSYSPLRDDAEAVVGMLCVVSEETERVVAERRMSTLRDLGSDLAAVRTEQEILAFTARQFERNEKSFPFTLTYLFEGGVARLAATSGIPVDHAAAPTVLAADDEGPLWPVSAAAKGEVSIVDLSGRCAEPLPTGTWSEPPLRAVVQPLPRQGGEPYGFVVAALNRYRPLDDGYLGFIELTAAHIAAGIAAARIHQAQRLRAEELAELDRVKTAFFSNVSHEFRTPLALIMGPLEELRARFADADARTREELDVVRRNAQRLGKLVNSLLDFSRLEAGRMQARFAPVDLAELTAELASVFRSAVDRSGLAYTVDCPPLPEPVYVDRSLWEKIVANLLSNALKFTFEGSIRVAVRAEEDHALVTVADTGVGVPEHEMPRLFERFHRIENTRARSYEGSGIGLALVKELVALHGGTIAAVSTEGEGTEFSIALPFGADHLPPEALIADPESDRGVDEDTDTFVEEALRQLPGDEADASDAPADPAAAHVLVVDDNADMRGYLARLLRGAGHRVTLAPDGESALEAVGATRFDLVISDVMMPGASGLDLVTALRRDLRTPGLPVLLLSARAGQEAAIEGLEAGADDYLVKPFTAAELLARVRANVELARLRTHHARWRNALVETLHDGFFVAADDGTVVEINAAFTEILGYGAEGLPYRPRYPWWPDAVRDPEGDRLAAEAFQRFLGEESGSCTVPATHRDGRPLWITTSFSRITDSETGRRMSVGTFRDVTAEHYAVQRDSAMASLTLRLSRAIGLDEALGAVLEEISRIWSTPRALAVVFPQEGEEPVVAAYGTDEDWSGLDAALRDELGALRDAAPLVVREGSGIGVAIGHPLGVVVLWLDLGGVPFSGQDRLLLSVLAGHLTQGLRRAHQVDEQRETALTLQRAILGPSALPPGFAVRYEPAASPLEVGGDWYDTIELPDGRIGVVVGDCVGRGLEAAAVMGQLRSACRALLLQEPRPGRVLATLDHFAAGIPGALCTTVFCGVLDPETGMLTYSSAGHPPGILACADGTTTLLDDARSFPLAVRPGSPRPSAVEPVPARATLLLYTDGLVERRRRPLTGGIAKAGLAVRDERDTGVEELAERLMARMAPAEGYEDDVAVLLYRHPGPFVTVFPAEPARLEQARDGLRRWLGRCDLPPATAQRVLVAAGEACANAVEHAHPPGEPGSVRLCAEAFAGHVVVTVADDGRWNDAGPPREGDRAHGTDLMREMVDDVDVSGDDHGTTVTLRIGVGR